MAGWAVMITSLTLLAEVHSPNAPALGSRSAAVPRLERVPVPGAAYAIGPRSGFRVGPRGEAIAAFTLPVPCVAAIELPRIPVRADETFSFRGSVGGASGRVRVSLAGRFAGPRSAIGVVTLEGRTCPQRQVSFTARLRP
jgi:hypothetical protein